MLVDCFHQAGKYTQELKILVRFFARFEQVHTIVGSQRPVVVFTGSIDSCKWFFMKEASQTMLGCGALQYIHYQEVAVQCCVSRCEDRCDLMLSRSYLVVLGLNSDTQFPELLIHICHEICDLGLQRSEVLILHLLSFRCRCSEKSTSSIDQVRTLQIFFTIYNKILLLRSNIRADPFSIGISKHFYKTNTCFADSITCFEQRSLGIQRLAGVRAECSRNTENSIFHICR